jgi:penicillin-binding protein 1A
MATKTQPTKLLPDGDKKKFTYWFWGFAMFPFVFVASLLLFQSEDSLPPVEMLDNPPELQASVVYAYDQQTELGKYFLVNRTSVKYREISPYVTDALISTEDERFKDHAGVDFRAVGRAIFSLGGAGGASTISQQLAKLLYTLQQREREELARARGERLSISSTRVGRIFGRINEKARENIIATRLEKRYTKEEIITMYLNQFDFLYNAVGIENAAKVYFNKKPKNLAKEEAAMLVGMCKNPALYNPYSFKIRNYRRIIATEKEISPSAVTLEEISARRASDSTRAVNRRNQVLFQWLKNSKAENEALRETITQEEYDALKVKPLVVNYQSVDHKQGKAPYFREYLRKELTDLLLQKKEDGSWKYAREDGTPYDIYRDGLKIYTTIDANLQDHAEKAVERHLSENLQKPFDQNNRSTRNFPFSNDLSEDQVKAIMRTARLNSPRYAYMSEAGYSEQEIVNAFNTPTQMRVFSWSGEKDTTLTPNDSIRYYKSFLHAGLISIEPQTGFIKAWVGGANITHFAYDHVKLSRRQVGSTIKPFVYGTAMAMGVVKPCTQFANTAYCVDLQDADGNVNNRWCPKNAGGSEAGVVTASTGLAQSMNNITVAVMSKMGGYAGPKNISKLLKLMDINLAPEQEVPALCLGIMDLSLFELVGAQCIFANKGIFNRPTSILRIEDRNGNVIYDNEANFYTKQVLNENVAFEVLQMMKKVITQGTGGSLRGGQSWGNVLYPTAGKTGTTQSNSDGWFVGLTPKLVTGVWVGAEDRGVRFRSMQWGQGARLALPIYGYYMQKVYKDPKIGLPTTDFEQPTSYDPKLFSCDGDPQMDVPNVPELGL